MADYCFECGGDARHLTWCTGYVRQLQPAGTVVEPRSTARARRTDPATSHIAAVSVKDLTETQQLVLRLLNEKGPMTDIELFQAWPQDWPTVSMSGLRTRRSELTEVGKVFDTDQRRLSPSGRPCVVWAAA